MITGSKNNDIKQLINNKSWSFTKYKAKKKAVFSPKFRLIVITTTIFLLITLFIISIRKIININTNANSNSKTKAKVALCVVAKKENRYIKYFVEFYEKFGYNHIYFYDNNEIGDGAIDDLEIVKDG